MASKTNNVVLPKEVPFVTPRDMCLGKLHTREDGTKEMTHCLVGWVDTAFSKSKNSKVRRAALLSIVKSIGINNIDPYHINVYDLNSINDIEKLSNLDLEEIVICVNDRCYGYGRTEEYKALRRNASIWNRAMKQLGYGTQEVKLKFFARKNG